MINNGITFGSDGPMMEGTWYNVKTGDSFTVRNTFFEDNQYVVQTTDGRILKYDQIQDYIKSDKPITVEKKQQTNNLPPEVADLVASDMLEDDYNMVYGKQSLGNINNSQPENYNTSSVVTHSISNNYDIIGKALTKRDLPDFQVGIKWDKCPTSEINMLMDLMDINEDEIVGWYLSQVDIENTTIMIREVIKDYLYKMLHDDEESIQPIIQKEESVVEPKKVIKKSKKK